MFFFLNERKKKRKNKRSKLIKPQVSFGWVGDHQEDSIAVLEFGIVWP